MPLRKFPDELAALKKRKLKWSSTGLVYHVQLDGRDARFDHNAITTFVDGIEPNRERAFKDPASLLDPHAPLHALIPLGTQKFEPAMGGWEIVVLAPTDEAFVTAMLARYYEHFRRNGCTFVAAAPDAPIVALKDEKRVGIVSPYCFEWSGPLHRAVAAKFGVATAESAPTAPPAVSAQWTDLDQLSVEIGARWSGDASRDAVMVVRAGRRDR